MPRNIKLKDNTIENLDKIAEIRIKELMKNKKLNISQLIKNKRGISYNDEIYVITEQYLYCHEILKTNPKLTCKEVIGKFKF